jgi:hypothetical protein
MKISNLLQSWLKENGFQWAIQHSEHPGCWDKQCSHYIEEVVIWEQKEPTMKWAFERGCSDDFIIKTLLKDIKINNLCQHL